MNKMRMILVLDVGTTNMKATIYDVDGNTLFTCSEKTNPVYFVDGRVEMDARLFREKVISILIRAVIYCENYGYALDGIALTSLRSPVMAVDAQGEPLSAFIMWQDKRTVEICKEYADDESFVYQRTGLRISPVFSALKMCWLIREVPELMAHCSKLIGVQDFIIHLLTGKFLTDYSFASRTNLFNLTTLDWDKELLSIFGIDRQLLCELVPPGTICGYLSEKISMLTGLTLGLPVITAGGDQQCAAIGHAVFDSATLLCNTGTASYLIGASDNILLDYKQRFFCNVSAIPGKYIVEAGLQSSGALYRWMADNFYQEYSEADRFKYMNADVEQVPPGAHGVILLPHFEGSGSPYWDSSDTGVIYNLSLGSSRGDIARAVLESIALEMSKNLTIFHTSLKNKKPFLIHVAGGLTKYSCFNQMLADIFSLEVYAGSDVQVTSRGAWMAATVSLGIFKQYAEAHSKITSPESLIKYKPNESLTLLYQSISIKRAELYKKIHTLIN